MREPLKPRQLPLRFGHSPRLRRDDLVVSQANAQAAFLIDCWPEWPAAVVLLAGPSGSGKSHLAAIWREHTDAVQLGASDITAHLSEIGATPVLVDDTDQGKLDQDGLFHLINTVRGAGSHLLLTAHSFPAAWGVTLPDLASRLKAAATVEIEEPDDLMLAGVITKLFSDRQVEVEPHVVQFLVCRIERSLSVASHIVDRIDRNALEQKTRITRSLAAEVVGAFDTGQGEFKL